MLAKETVFCIVCGEKAIIHAGHLHDPDHPGGIVRDRDDNVIMAGFCGHYAECANVDWKDVESLSRIVRLIWHGSICKNTGCYGWWRNGYGLQIRNMNDNSVIVQR